MGIIRFFSWFSKNFENEIYKLKNKKTFIDCEESIINEIIIDNLLVDMNGLFHNSTQKIFEYGAFKPQKSFFNKMKKEQKKDIDVFIDICENVNNLVKIVKPKKRIVLCVDGPAPLSKQTQQRKRRFCSSEKKEENDFDSNSLTPGTEFMDKLTKYVEYYIVKKMTEEDPLWCNVEVVFSNEKIPGEGEHKLINFIKKLCDKNDFFCLCGMDADLIMLSLATHLENFYILREEPRDKTMDFYIINIGNCRKKMYNLLNWGNDKYNSISGINDFIFMCFTIGNDFLPHMPCIEIAEGGIDIIISSYKNIGKNYGHLTKISNTGNIRFSKTSTFHFLKSLSEHEQSIFNQKVYRRKEFFVDDILEKNINSIGTVDIENYKKDYYSTKGNILDMEKFCHEYLEGMQWVLSYYTKGVPDWKWKFDHHYAPFSSTLVDYMKSFEYIKYQSSEPILPFIQLLCVLPPKSHKLLPQILGDVLNSKQMEKFCPKKVNIDLAGKRQEYEGIPILPFIEYKYIEELYNENIENIDKKDMKRNIINQTSIFSKGKKEKIYKSIYGNIETKIKRIHVIF